MSDLIKQGLLEMFDKETDAQKKAVFEVAAKRIANLQATIQHQSARIKELERQLEIQTNVNGHMAESNREMQNIILGLQDKPNTTN